MKIGDLVFIESSPYLGLVASNIRASTSSDNYQIGLMYGDVMPVVTVIVKGQRRVIDVDELKVIEKNKKLDFQ